MTSESKFSNQQVAKLLRSVAAALNIKKAGVFQVRAYENAADGIEHLTSEVKDMWEDGKLDDIPGVGKSLQAHLEEYFKTGEVKHFQSLQKGIEPVVFDLLDIPGVGPKSAQDLAKLGVDSLERLQKLLNNGELVKRGLSQKMADKIQLGLNELSGRTDRMLLPFADVQAQKILEYLHKGPGVKEADPLGSLRRRVATIGDLDFAAATLKSEEMIDYFTKMPGISQVVEKGENKAMVVLSSGLHVDLLVGNPDTYGALLQHFTGSKHHNIKLRTYAQKLGLSLSEKGVRKESKSHGVKESEGDWIPCKTESDLYKMLKMDTPDPEIREDFGEIEAALRQAQGKVGGLPNLVEAKDIKGDFHLHSNFPMERPSHGPGVNPMDEIVKEAIKYGYEYVGISDHPPGFKAASKEQVIKILAARTKELDKLKELNKKSIRVLNGLEIDILPDGGLSVPEEVLKTLDYCIAGIHSSHRMEKDGMTKRLLKALESEYVDIISHPTGRLLNERDSFEADWEVIFKFCAAHNKLLEINSFPNRLDLRDDLVRMALALGCKFIINTDAHEISQMVNMPYGVSVARRGWVEAKDVVNTWEWKKVAEWFGISD